MILSVTKPIKSDSNLNVIRSKTTHVSIRAFYIGLDSPVQIKSIRVQPILHNLDGSPQATDTNAICLCSSDAAGFFADSMWHPAFFAGPIENRQYYARNPLYNSFNRKMLLRLRVKITQPVTDTVISPPTLCTITLTEVEDSIFKRDDHDVDTLVVRSVNVSTIKVNSAFKHINSNFDIIEQRFIRDSINPDDKVSRMYFSFSWPKEVNAVFDYMELLTAHINSTDHNVGDVGYVNIDSGEASAFSAEDFLAPTPTELGKLVSKIKQNYLGHVNYIYIGDEFPSMLGLSFKRLVKMMHDSTN
jgi:hypothetical protein